MKTKKMFKIGLISLHVIHEIKSKSQLQNHSKIKSNNRMTKNYASLFLPVAMLMTPTALHAEGSESQSIGRVNVDGSYTPDADTDGTESYKANASTVGTKLPTNIREIPQSVSVITQQRIKDQNLRTTQEATNQVASVSNALSPEGFQMVRGFGAKTMINGVSADSLVGRTQADSIVFDRVEVLKGPAGLMSGSGSPGGAINYEFKKPMDEFHIEASAGYGSRDAFTKGIDVTGPLNESGTLRARGILFNDKRHEEVNVEKHNRTSMYGVIDWDITDKTTASIGYYQQKNRATSSFRQGLPAYTDGGLLWDVNRRTSLTQDWSSFKYKASWLLADISQQFNDEWSGKISFRQGKSETPGWYSQPKAFGGSGGCGDLPPFQGVVRGDPNGGKQCFNTGFYNDVTKQRDIDIYIAGKFPLFGYEHELVVGADWQRNSFLRAPFVYADSSYDFINDVFNPNPHVINRPPRPNIGPYGDPSVTRTNGIYVRAVPQLTSWLKIPIGARATWVNPPNQNDEKVRGEITPYAGLVATINKNWTVYTSYTEIFEPTSFYRQWDNANPNGKAMPYQKGKQYEIGVKSSWFDEQLLATASIYNLTLENVARQDIEHSSGPRQFYYPGGEQRTRGFELDVNGELTPAWRLGLSYAYMDAKYTKDDNAQGQRVLNTPKHTATLYTNYKFEEGYINGLSIGGGMRAQSQIEGETLPAGSDGKRLKAPGYTTTYLRASYDVTKNTEISVNINNLFNKTYWQQLGSTTSGNYYGDGRNVMFNVRATY